jgi:hypothetical protein
MSKEMTWSDTKHLIKNKCQNSILIDIIALIDTNKLENKWYNGIEISDVIAVFENSMMWNLNNMK